MRILKLFVYLTEKEENEMGFGPLEFRPLTRHPKKKNSLYLGQWRVGMKVTEGRGVLFKHTG